MIGFLRGEVLSSHRGKILVLTSSGIGFELQYFQDLAPGQTIQFFTTQIFKEDGQWLFGHPTRKHKALFELLLKVKGVGPKSAYSMVGTLSPEKLILAITLEQKALLRKVPGIGPRAASQIILDLKQKINAEMGPYGGAEETPELPLGLVSKADPSKEILESPFPLAESQKVAEALTALLELGLKEEDVLKPLTFGAQKKENTNSEELVRYVLKSLNKKKQSSRVSHEENLSE